MSRRQTIGELGDGAVGVSASIVRICSNGSGCIVTRDASFGIDDGLLRLRVWARSRLVSIMILANNSHFLLDIQVVSTMSLEISLKTGVQLARLLLAILLLAG